MIELSYSREIIFKRWLLQIGLLAMGMLASYFRSGSIRYSGPVLVGLSIIFSFVSLKRGIAAKPQIMIDSEGINDLRLGIGVLPWSAIKSSKIYQAYGAQLILLSLSTPQVFVSKLSFFNRTMFKWYALDNSGDIVLDMSSLRADIPRVLSIIQEHEQSSNGRIR
jgi:hypothetical protein